MMGTAGGPLGVAGCDDVLAVSLLRQFTDQMIGNYDFISKLFPCITLSPTEDSKNHNGFVSSCLVIV